MTERALYMKKRREKFYSLGLTSEGKIPTYKKVRKVPLKSSLPIPGPKPNRVEIAYREFRASLAI